MSDSPRPIPFDRKARAQLRRRARAVAWLPWNYAKEFKLRGIDRPVMLVVRLLADSWATRIGLLLLLAGTVSAAWLLSRPAVVVPMVESGPTVVPADFAAILLLAGAWAAGVGVVSAWPLWAFGFAGLYLVYTAILPGGPFWVRTPMLALPSLWLLFLAAWIFRATRPRHVGHILIWALVSWGAAWVTVGPLRVRALFGETRETMAIVVLGSLYFLIGCFWAARNRQQLAHEPEPNLGIWRRVEQRFNTPPTFGISAGVSLVILGVYWGSSLWYRTPESVENAQTVTTLVLGQVDLLWMGLGGGFLLGAVGVGRWMTRATYDVISPRAARWFWPIVWAGSGAVSWIMFWSTSMFATMWVYYLGLKNWRLDMPTSMYFAGKYHGLASAVALLVLVVLALFRKATPRAVSTVNAFWVAGYLGLLAWFATGERTAGLAGGKSTFSDFWPAFVLLGGVLWSLGKSERNWLIAPRRKLEIQLALMTLILGLAVSPVGLGSVNMFGVQSLATLVGMTHLGLPRVIHTEIMRRQRLGRDQSPTSGELLVLFALGAVLSVPVLAINVQPGPHVLLAIPMFVVTLVIVRVRRPRWVTIAGVSAGAAVALGFAWGWWFPPAYEIPFVAPWLRMRQAWADANVNRFSFGWEHVFFVLVTASIGAAIGFGLFRWKNRKSEASVSDQSPSVGPL